MERGTGFKFRTAVNLEEMSQLRSVNVGVGYEFTGGVTGTVMKSCSFEGQTVSVVTNGTVYNLAARDCYGENVDDVYFKFNAPVESFVAENSYFVMGASTFLLDYLELPQNNIDIKQSNTFVGMTDSKYIKTVTSAGGSNYITITKKPHFNTIGIDEYIVDNANFPPQCNYTEFVEELGLKTKKVNKYAIGVYGGQYTDGFARSNGFLINAASVGTTSMLLDTRIVPSDTGRIYVNIRINDGGFTFLKGEFIDDVFYEFTPTGVIVTTDLTVATVFGYRQLRYTTGGNIVRVDGEVRLV